MLLYLKPKALSYISRETAILQCGLVPLPTLLTLLASFSVIVASGKDKHLFILLLVFRHLFLSLT